VERMRDQIREAEAICADLDVALAALADPARILIEAPIVTAWGQGTGWPHGCPSVSPRTQHAFISGSPLGCGAGAYTSRSQTVKPGCQPLPSRHQC
jgi:hypothetical protein